MTKAEPQTYEKIKKEIHRKKATNWDNGAKVLLQGTAAQGLGYQGPTSIEEKSMHL